MSPEQIKAAIEALRNQDGDAALAILEAALVEAASGTAPGADELAVVETPEPQPADPMKKPEEATALSILLSSTGAKTAEEAGVRLRSLITGYESTESQRQTVALATRRDLIGKLVKLGAETPATAWAGEPDQRKPCKRLAAMDLGDMTTWVTQLEAAKGKSGSTELTPPESEETPGTASGGDVSAQVKQLSADVLAAIKKRGMTPEAFIEERNKATRRNTGKK